MAATEAQRRYLAALFFHGLSNEAHRDLKKKIHSYALTGSDTVPCTYNKVLQLTDQYKSYSGGKYKNGTVHITVDLGHDTDHPSPINSEPLMHVLGTAMLHYTNPEARAITFAQSYSFKVGLKKFGDVGKTVTMTELTQLHTYETYHPVHTNSPSPDKR